MNVLQLWSCQGEKKEKKKKKKKKKKKNPTRNSHQTLLQIAYKPDINPQPTKNMQRRVQQSLVSSCYRPDRVAIASDE